MTAAWKKGPRPGSTWRGKSEAVDGRKLTETRHVIDRTLGGSVVYVSGRLTRFAMHSTVALVDWNEWAVRTAARRPRS
jgi:hypothetical protein